MLVHRISSALLGLVVAFALGCAGPPQSDPSDPEVGRELLKRALEAWKNGETHEAYKQSAALVTVIEPAWTSGSKLIDYEINAEHETAGYNVRFKVLLNLQDKSGSPKKHKALYKVSTTPNLVVNRAEGSW